MKTNLFKTMMLAVGLMASAGAWAVDFGTEEVVSTTTTWTFDGIGDGSLDADDALSPEMDDILLDFE